MASRHFARYLSFAGAGLGIGWLAGLSTSPVVGTVLASILAIATGFIMIQPDSQQPIIESTEAGEPNGSVRGQMKARVSTATFAVFILSIVMGSTAGVWVRTRDLLAPPEDSVIQKWAKDGVTAAEVRRMLLLQRYGSVGGAKSEAIPETHNPERPRPNIQAGVLFGVTFDDCTILRASQGKVLRNRMSEIGDERLRSFVQVVHDDKTLETTVATLLCPANSH